MTRFFDKATYSIRSGEWKDFVDPHVGVYIGLGLGRFLVALGAIYRFLTHPAELTQTPFGIKTQLLLLIVWVGYLLFLPTWLLPVVRRKPVGPQAAPQQGNRKAGFFATGWVWSQIIGDCIFFTLLYALTMKPESDFYLFYFLPVLVGALFLDFSPIRIFVLAALPFSFCLLTISC